jgi:hypothetical protein
MLTQELGVIVKSGLRHFKPTSLRSFSTINENAYNFTLTSTDEEKRKPTHQIKTSFSGFQDPILQACRAQFCKLMQQTPKSRNEIRGYHEEINNLEWTLRSQLQEMGFITFDGESFVKNPPIFQDIEGNPIDSSTSKNEFESMFARFASIS